METKTYFASSVQAAMEVARRELGADAMLVASRTTVDQAKQFGRLEVTFAWEPPATAPGIPAITAFNTPKTKQLSGLEDIRLEISALRAAIGRQPGPAQAGEAAVLPVIDPEAMRTLCDTGLRTELAREILMAARSAGNVREGILRELKSRIPDSGFTPLKPDESRALAFVGPSGRGKTTSLVKIAVRYGLAARIPVRIFSAGAHGVGAVEQMARYAGILGVPFQALESFEGLNLALQGERWKGLVLIDTPAFGSGDGIEIEEMARFFHRRTDIETHLVLRAEACSADMEYMVSHYTPVRLSRLLFTGVDEVRGLGAAAGTMIRSGLGATFFGTGNRIPEDLEEVSIPRLTRSLWAANELAARAA